MRVQYYLYIYMTFYVRYAGHRVPEEYQTSLYYMGRLIEIRRVHKHI